MNPLAMFLGPVVCAALGWGVGVLAPKLLFRPYTPVRVGPWRVQGLLPARQGDLARQLGEMAEQELFSAQDLARAMDSEEFRTAVRNAVSDGLDRLLDGESRLGSLIGTLVTAKARESLKQSLSAKLEALSSGIAASSAQGLAARLRLGERVREHLAALPPQELEAMLKPRLRPSLRRLALALALLGFVLGWVEVAILALPW